MLAHPQLIIAERSAWMDFAVSSAKVSLIERRAGAPAS
jgi:hypothetical protein